MILGENVVLEHGAGIAAHLLVTVGDGVCIGPYTLVMDTNFHNPEDPLHAPEPRAVSIGAGALLGANCVVLPGARIGAGARLAAGSVVSGLVPPGAQVSGVPALEGRDAALPPALENAVLQSMQEAFHLPRLPSLSAQREEIREWDAQGGLSAWSWLSLERRPFLSIRARAGGGRDRRRPSCCARALDVAAPAR